MIVEVNVMRVDDVEAEELEDARPGTLEVGRLDGPATADELLDVEETLALLELETDELLDEEEMLALLELETDELKVEVDRLDDALIVTVVEMLRVIVCSGEVLEPDDEGEAEVVTALAVEPVAGTTPLETDGLGVAELDRPDVVVEVRVSGQMVVDCEMTEVKMEAEPESGQSETLAGQLKTVISLVE